MTHTLEKILKEWCEKFPDDGTVSPYMMKQSIIKMLDDLPQHADIEHLQLYITDKSKNRIPAIIEITNKGIKQVIDINGSGFANIVLPTNLKAVGGNWQPIECAPKNTKILLHIWNAYLHGHVKTGIVDPDKYDKGVWSYYDTPEHGGMVPEKYCGYWQPLPIPPAGEK